MSHSAPSADPTSPTGSRVPPGADPGAPVCYRHPDRETYIRCQRCGRPVCPEDMRPASVGFQCPECVREGSASLRRPRTVLGGAVRRREGLVTTVLVALCLLGFAAQYVVPDTETRLALLGGPVFDARVGLVGGVAGGQWWRLLTAGFLHAGVLHLAVNMFSLWVIGRPLEAALGRARFAALYLLGLVGADAVAYLLTPPNAEVVGASGAIFALLGAMLVLARRLGADVRGLVGILVVNAVISAAGAGISWQAHAGGFAAGAVMGAGMLLAARRRSRVPAVAGFVLVLAASVAVVAARTAQLT